MSISTTSPVPARRRPIPVIGSVWAGIRQIIRKPNGFIGFFATLFFILMAFLGPVIVPEPKVNPSLSRQGPTAEYPFGTDFQGRSILSLIIRGGRDVMTVSLLTASLTTLIAVTFGSLAAYLGGFVDRLITSLGNFILTIPYLILISVLAAFIKFTNPSYLALLLAVLFWPSLMRTVRAQVLSLRERDYIEAAQALDLSTLHIIVREILPNMASYIVISMIFAITNAIYAQIALIFLGLVPLSGSNWGIMIANANTQGAINSPNTALWLLAPVLTIGLLQWSLITLGRSIEEVFNPRLKSGG